MRLKKQIAAAALAMIMTVSAYGCAGATAEAKNIKITIRGTSQISKKSSKEFTVPWKDSYFSAPSTDFNSKLAYVSMAYSAAAYTDNKASYVHQALKSAGFTGISSGSSYSSNSREGIGYTIARKKLADGHTLLAVILRGSSGKEWYGNFDIAQSSASSTAADIHYNFKQAETKVMNSLKQYYRENQLTAEHTRIWITGHSRGAAVANLLAAEVNQSGLADISNIYAYTFAAPNTVKQPVSWDNIFNLMNQGDFFTGVPLKQWDYKRYGRDIVLNDLFLKAGLSQTKIDQGIAIPFKTYTGAAYSDYSYDVSGMNQLISQAAVMSPDVSNYYSRKLSFGSEKITMYQYFQLLADVMAGDDASRAEATRKLGKSVLGADDYSQLSVALMNLALSGNVYYAHMPENYLSWLQIMSDSDMDLEGSMKPVILKKAGKTKLAAGKKSTYQALALGTDSPIRWSVSNKKLASINKKGVLTARKKGTVKITAKAGKAKGVFTVKITK